jgi:hypothetical protein
MLTILHSLCTPHHPTTTGPLQVTDAGGNRLDFSRGRWLDLDRGIIAAPPHVHAKLLEAVAAVSQKQ